MNKNSYISRMDH